MRILMVNWLQLLELLFVTEFLARANGIQVFNQNVTKPQLFHKNETIIPDSQISPSERNRRLIPYMAFYLPAPELPINQQYAIQKPKQQESQRTLHTKNQQPIGPPQNLMTDNMRHVPMPTAYVHMKIPAAGPGPDNQHFQSNNADVYHTITYGGQHPLPKQQRQHAPYPQHKYSHQHPNTGNHQSPHYMTTGAGASSNSENLHYTNGNSVIRFKPPNKQKTVQHFPPLSHSELNAERAANSHSLVPISSLRHRPKQEKININPFTASNSVPGHFVPIVFSPVVTNGKNDNHASSNIYNNDGNEQHIQLQHNAYKPAAPGEDYVELLADNQFQAKDQLQTGPSPPSVLIAKPQKEQLHHDHIQFFELTVTPSPTGNAAVSIQEAEASVTASPSSQGPSSSIHHGNDDRLQKKPQLDLSSLSPMSPQYNHHQKEYQNNYHPRIANTPTSRPFPIHKPQYESYYTNDDTVDEKQTLQQLQQQQIQQLSPQQKYTRFLQQEQRIHNNKQQLLPQYTRHSEGKEEPKHLNFQNSPPESTNQSGLDQVFFYSTTAAPHYVTNNDQKHSSNSFATQDQQQESKQSHEYPHHSPIRHATHLRAEIIVPPNHQPNEKSRSHHVIQIPVKTMVNHVDKLVHQQYFDPQNQHQEYINALTRKQKGDTKYFKNENHSTYVDFVIEEPKQSLDEDHSFQKGELDESDNRNSQQVKLKPTQGPQQSYILVSTVGTYHDQPQYFTTAKPHYGPQQELNHQSATKIHLQNMKNEQYEYYEQQSSRTPIKKPTIGPSYDQEHQNAVTPNSIYQVTPQPNYAANAPLYPLPTAAIKLRPAYKYKQQPYRHQQKEVLKDEQEEHRQQEQFAKTTAPVLPLEKKVEKHVPVTPAIKPQSPNLKLETSHLLAGQQQEQNNVDTNQLPDIRTSSLADILHKLQASNHLPQTLTPDNIDNSIKTLITILNNLKKSQTIPPPIPVPLLTPVLNGKGYKEHVDEVGPLPTANIDYTNDYRDDGHGATDESSNENHKHDIKYLSSPGKPGPNSGRPGVDYPNYSEIPQTSFECTDQRYKGFFGDPETNCQVWHYCDLNGGKASFLCPNGTIFSQIALTCDWWFNVKCSTTAQLYVLNERLYKYILPFTPKFPEDYSGPLVDKYLAMKFQEMEEKMRLQKEKSRKPTEEEPKDNHIDETSVSSSKEDQDRLTDEIEIKTTIPAIIVTTPPMNITKPEVNPNKKTYHFIFDDDPIEDIAEKGSIDTFETETTTFPSPDSLSAKPIIVSSTVPSLIYHKESLEDNNNNGSNLEDSQENYQKLRTTQSTITTASKNYLPKMIISVEKVKVIEIKPDGDTGHIIPENYLKKKK